MSINLNELRIKIDQLNEEVISGIKHRTRFALNKRVFENEFAEGKSWFLYRLKKEQDVDSKFGRFLFEDQQPFLFNKDELDKPIVKRKVKQNIEPVRVDMSEKLIIYYKILLKEICGEGENENEYGEVAKLDVNNVLLFNERTVGIGEQVAEYKIQENQELLKLKNKEEIRAELFRPYREKEVIEKMQILGEKYEIKNIDAIGDFAKKLIDITMETEIDYILSKSGEKK
jgi:chorismate mutase